MWTQKRMVECEDAPIVFPLAHTRTHCCAHSDATCPLRQVHVQRHVKKNRMLCVILTMSDLEDSLWHESKEVKEDVSCVMLTGQGLLLCVVFFFLLAISANTSHLFFFRVCMGTKQLGHLKMSIERVVRCHVAHFLF